MEQREPRELRFIPLPDEQGSGYFEALVHNCIVAYSKLFSDKMALDYNMVPDAMRMLVLEDPAYKQETRSIKAKQMMDEIDEIEDLAAIAIDAGDDPYSGMSEEDYFDPRNPKAARKKRRSVTADKDMINMRFKAAQLRRDLLNLSIREEGSEEAAALNIFFVPLNREEFEKLEVVTSRKGEDTGTGAFSPAEEPVIPGLTGSGERREDDPALYMEHENGDIEEV
jgi:hypothetical protein